MVYFKHPVVQDFIDIKKHNNTMVLVDNLYNNKTSIVDWEAIKKTIFCNSYRRTCFHCGAVFFRKEQEKEHFKIRI